MINLLSLRPLDMASVVKSIKKTNHIVTVEDGWPLYVVSPPPPPPPTPPPLTRAPFFRAEFMR